MLSLEFLKSNLVSLEGTFQSSPFLGVTLFFGIIVVLTSLPLPGTSVISVLAGALFGFWGGGLTALTAAATGASVALIVCRRLEQSANLERYSRHFEGVHALENYNIHFVLFALRLSLVIPSFIVNILMSFTKISVLPFFLVTFLGRLPIFLIYANAGTHLAEVKDVDDIFSWKMIISLALIGMFPLVMNLVIRKFLKLK